MVSTPLISKVACIGGGLIGGGWAARFMLLGVDVAVYDPHPDAERIVNAIVANATTAWGRLTAVPLPQRGKLTFAASIAEAVAGADFIQESVPERLDLKRRVLAEIDASARPDAIVASSTSGLLPTDMQAGMVHPERLLVGHPYNPVYLLPLVELVGGRETSAGTIERAKAVYTMLGMKPVHIAKEIDGFVGDRLQEAAWREALWLIKDDICDVGTLDDVIRYSFGLRSAQMGIFEQYRIAGGEAGMRHSLAQFGPCLSWPLSKLTDVPDLDDALLDKIAAQSDMQARDYSISQLEQIRDENLIAIMHGLKGADGGKGWGAGEALNDLEAQLWQLAAADPSKATSIDLAKPLRLHQTTVSGAWLDYNGHMTEYRYSQVFGDAIDGVLRLIGIDAASSIAGSCYYVAESFISFRAEAKVGTALQVETQVLGAKGKRLHLFHRLFNAETCTCHATAEHLLLHVSNGHASDPPPVVAERLAEIATAQAALPFPPGAGRVTMQKTA